MTRTLGLGLIGGAAALAPARPHSDSDRQSIVILIIGQLGNAESGFNSVELTSLRVAIALRIALPQVREERDHARVELSTMPFLLAFE